MSRIGKMKYLKLSKPYTLYRDIAGQKFGRLIAMRPTKEISRGCVVWECHCECGNECLLDISRLTSGNTRSCGCLAKDHSTKLGKKYGKIMGKGNAKEAGVAGFNAVYKTYIRNAKQTNRDFALSKEEFKNIVIKNCHYCGIKPSNVIRRKSYNGDFTYSGIDRVDSSKGYTVDNCVPCCKLCNGAKSNLSMKEFSSWIYRISAHKDNWLINE